MTSYATITQDEKTYILARYWWASSRSIGVVVVKDLKMEQWTCYIGSRVTHAETDSYVDTMWWVSQWGAKMSEEDARNLLQDDAPIWEWRP